MKYRFFYYLLTMTLLTGVFSSCWGDFEELSFSSANLKSFSFGQQDTCVGIQYYTFYIDQDNGIVFNADSLPFGRSVNFLVPTFEFYSSNDKVMVGDTLYDASNDTLDFTSPVKLTNTSEDGKYTRNYWVHVNVHQVDPDSLLVESYGDNLPAISYRNKAIQMADGEFRVYFPIETGGLSAYKSNNSVSNWMNLPVDGLVAPMNVASLCYFNSTWFVTDQNGLLYVSPDGLSWSLQSSTVSFVTLFSKLTSKDPATPDLQYLIGLTKSDDGTIHGVRSTDGVNWEEGASLDADFPVYECANTTHATVTKRQYLTVMTGLRADLEPSSSVWSTEDGLYWIEVTQSLLEPVKGLRGANLFYYEDSLVCYGGVRASGEALTQFYVSKDHGKRWVDAPHNWRVPTLEAGEAYGSVVVQAIEDLVNDKDRVFVWHFGGLNGGRISQKVWKTYKNQALFIRR